MARVLHLVDLENLLGGSERDPGEVLTAWEAYEQSSDMAAGDHVIVGTGPRLASVAWFVLPAERVRLVLGRGVDGGERAILEVIDEATVVRSYDRLVIGSGDHAFIEVALSAHRSGVEVWVVSRRQSLCGDLRRAADHAHGLYRPAVALAA